MALFDSVTQSVDLLRELHVKLCDMEILAYADILDPDGDDISHAFAKGQLEIIQKVMTMIYEGEEE